MILVDLFCPDCDNNQIDVFIDTSIPLPDCDKCGVMMKKSIGPINFKLVYNNRTDMCDWDGNTTRYWDDIKKKGGDEPQNDGQQKWI